MFDDKEIDAALLSVVDRQAAELEASDIDMREKVNVVMFEFGILDTVKELSRPFLDSTDGRRALKMGLRHMSEMLADASERVNINERHSQAN